MDRGTIELRLLGSLSTRTDGHEVGAVLAQPKRIALLAYLAAATPRGFHRRDVLLPLFWPDADQEHARTSLRKALHFLRHELGAELIQSRGDEEVALAPDRCWCDAVAFDDAVQGGRPEEALALYRGDFLAGFHLPDSPEFERWMEETRSRLRERGCRAAGTLADRAGAKHELDSAVTWARRANALAPYDETGVRRLVTLLDGAGDRPGAVLAYEEFALRLANDLELEPSEETSALVETIRRREGGSAPSRATRKSSTEGAAAVAPDGESSAGPARSRHGRRVSLLGLGLWAIGVGGVAGAVIWREWPRHAPPASPGVIAILPFDYQGSAGLRYLADGMGDLLSTKLDGAGGLRTVDPHALGSFASKDGTDPLQQGQRAAQRFGADRFVLGRIVEAGGRVQVGATIYDRGGGPQGTVEAVAGDPARVFDMADRLAEQILARSQDRPLVLARIADQTTASLPALKAYMEGERDLRNGQVGPATEDFKRAAELDSDFALAHYRLGTLSPRWAEARLHLARAVRHSSLLGEHQRLLIEARDAVVRGEHRRAEQLYRLVLTQHPDDVEAWQMLGMLITDKSPFLGLAWIDASEPFERTLQLDPQHGLALWTLASIAARERRLDALDSLTDRFIRLQPAAEFAEDMEGQRAVLRGDTAGLERFVVELRGRADRAAQTGAGFVANTTMNLTVGRRLWRLITEPSHSPGYRAMAHVILAKIELTGGRPEAAWAELGQAASLDPRGALEYRVFYALTPFLSTTRAELLALRDSLERRDLSQPPPTDQMAALHRPEHPYLKPYLLGLLNARLGDEARARRYVAELERSDSASIEGAFAHDGAGVIRAEIARAGGRTQEALTRLEQAGFWTGHSSNEDTGDSPLFTRMHERWARAELLYQLGRYDEALTWYRTLVYDFVYTGPANFRTARIAEIQGDRTKAIEHYRRFVELWKDCDPALRPMREQAESALARLGS